VQWHKPPTDTGGFNHHTDEHTALNIKFSQSHPQNSTWPDESLRQQ